MTSSKFKHKLINEEANLFGVKRTLAKHIGLMFSLNKIANYFSSHVLKILDKPIKGALHVKELILLIGLIEEVPFDIDSFFCTIF